MTVQAVSATPVLDGKLYRMALGSFPTGVAIVTAKPPGGPAVGLTVNSFASVSLDPPLVLWSLRRDAPSREPIVEAGNFVVNILSVDQGDLARQFSQAASDKFHGVGTFPNVWNVPCIENCIARFECSIAATHDGGDHIIFLGAVQHFEYVESSRPLVFCQGRFISPEPDNGPVG
jgi:flavin reductase (DIM6/NTAB) family NADH-FMN oxidoreductase RutF